MKQNTMIKLLALTLILALALALAVPALAAGTELIVTAPGTAPKAGETFEVTVEIKGNPGFHTLDFVLGFDRTVAVCDEIEVGSIIKNSLYVTNPSYSEGGVIALASLNPLRGDGLLATFRFTAQADLSGTVFTVPTGTISDSDGNKLDMKLTLPTAYPGETPAQSGSSGGTGTGSGGEQPTQTVRFTDVKGHWGEEWIVEAAKRGYFKGNEDGSFRPDANVTRAQFVTVLYRMAGSPAVTAAAPFTDLDRQIEEFRSAIAWAWSKGYVNGRTATTFDPTGSITRQEAMKILRGYAGGGDGAELMFTAIYDESFQDSGELADWGKGPMYWGVYHELISGTAAHTLSPRGTATRAQLAKILVNYANKYM